MSSFAPHRHRGTHSISTKGFGSDGGDVEDIFKRLGNVETDVSALKSEVSAIRATIPYLATKADVMDVRTAVADLESRIIKWIIATVLASAGLAFTIAKFVH